MQSKITLKRFGGFWRKSLTALALLCSVTGAINAQTYVNGNLGTGPVARNGATAPAGFQWHELQNNNGNTTVANASLAFAYTGTFTVADNFTVPAGETWTISKMVFYGIQPTAGAVTALNVRIHNSSPLAGATTIAYGDLTTNRLGAVTPLNIYGAFNSLVPPTAPGTAYRIFSMDANVATVLTAGTYWVEWKVTAAAATFAPTSAVVGVRTQNGYNSIQSNSGTWTALVDAGTPASTPSYAQDLPFSINYTAAGSTACAGTPAPGNTVASVATVCPGVLFNLSLQTPTAGSGVTYQWQTSTTLAGTYTDIIGATAATLTYSQAAATYYRCQVTCGGNTGTSTPVQVAASAGCYCTPVAVNCNLDDQITNVTLGTLNNNSTCGAGGYTNYTTNPAIAIPDVIKGGANPIRVTVGPGGTEYVGVWIDYNQNGTFETTEFTLIGSGNGATIAGNIPVPTTALSGNTRMRVRVQYNTPVLNTQSCAATSGFGEVEDYTVNLIPCVVSTVTTQPPATTTISCSGTGTIRATIGGSLNLYQWQVLATGAGAVWTDLANGAQYTGVTTNTLTITNALPTIDGYQYRVRYSGGCTSPSVTTASTLTVGALAPTVSNTLPINRCITDAPTAISIATPVGLAALSTTTSAAGLHINIPDNNDEDANENDHFISNNLTVAGIPTGATITGFNVKLNITHAWVGDLIMVLKAPNGKTINLAYALSATGGAAASTGFANTVISSTGTAALSSGTNPYTATFRLDNAGPSTAGFTPTGPLGFDPNTTVLSDMYQGNGVWTLALYDYYQDNTNANFLETWELNLSYLAPPAGVFTPATGLFTDPAGTIAYVAGTPVSTVYAIPTTTTIYSATVNTAVCGAGTVSIPVNVSTPLSGTSTVANVSACQGSTVTFSSTAPTGGVNATYQWQISTDAGVTWTNITGATAATYTIANVTTTMSGNRFRVVRTVASCAASTLTSSAGTLTVSLPSVLNLAAAPTTAVFPGITTSVVVAVNPAPSAGTTYNWFLNGSPITGATTNTISGLDIDDLGTYTVRVSEANGCSTLSNAVTIRDSANTTLFIYPNPTSNGQFHVRYHALVPTATGTRSLTIYDAKGSRVYQKEFSTTAPYTDMFIDLGNYSKGIYSIDVTDYNGTRLQTGRVMIQ